MWEHEVIYEFTKLSFLNANAVYNDECGWTVSGNMPSNFNCSDILPSPMCFIMYSVTLQVDTKCYKKF